MDIPGELGGPLERLRARARERERGERGSRRMEPGKRERKAKRKRGREEAKKRGASEKVNPDRVQDPKCSE